MLRRLAVRVGSSLHPSSSSSLSFAVLGTINIREGKRATVECPTIAVTQGAHRYFHTTPLRRGGSGTGSARQKKAAVKAVFGKTDWATFESKIPNWEKDLVKADFNTTVRALAGCGIHMPRTLDRANSLLEYFEATVRKPPPREVVFKQHGSWPTLFAPPTKRQSKKKSELSFVETTDGDWCLKPDDRWRMIRHREYPQLWQVLVNERKKTERPRRKGLLIQGHPDIGKTLLLDLLLSWSLYAHRKQPVIVITPEGMSVFTNVDGKPKRYEAPLPRVRSAMSANELKALGISKDDPLLVLHDIRTTIILHYQGGIVESLVENFDDVTVVVSSAPKEENFKDFANDFHGCSRFVLPTLSLSEAKEFVEHKAGKAITADEISEYYHNVGGVPRHLWPATERAAAVRNQQRAVKGLYFEPGNEAADADLKDTNKIVQAIPSDDRKSISTFDFVSGNARRLWLEGQDDAMLSKQLRRLREAKDVSARDPLGHFFEEWFLGQLTAGRQFCFSRLGTKSAGHLERWNTPSSQSLSRNYFPGSNPTRIKATKGVNTLYIPMGEKCGAVDAVLVESGKATLIQVTIANQHRPKLGPLKQLVSALTKSSLTIKAFVWVVDSASTLSATKVPAIEGDDGSLPQYKSIPHFHCRVDEYMCWVQNDGTKNQQICFPMPSQNPRESEVLSQIQRFVNPKAKKLVEFEKEIGTSESPLAFKIE